jgi:hypothetical protein
MSFRRDQHYMSPDTVGEDIADVVNRSLYFVDVPGLLPFHHQGGADDLSSGHDVQEEGLARLQRGQDQRFGDERVHVIKCLLHGCWRPRRLLIGSGFGVVDGSGLPHPKCGLASMKLNYLGIEGCLLIGKLIVVLSCAPLGVNLPGMDLRLLLL